MGTGKVALTSENGEIKRNVSFGKSKPELTFLFIISSIQYIDDLYVMHGKEKKKDGSR